MTDKTRKIRLPWPVGILALPFFLAFTLFMALFGVAAIIGGTLAAAVAIFGHALVGQLSITIKERR